MPSLPALTSLVLLGGAAARTIQYDTLVGNFSEYKGGLYQSAFSNDTNKLYVTSSLGRPPINASDLLEVDPATLKVLKDVHPQFASNATGIYAVYGISLDRKTGRIWTTHTRQNTVGYYNEQDLSLGLEFPDNVEAAPRDIFADHDTGLAYASSSRGSIIDVFSPDHKNGTFKSLNISELSGKNFTTVMSLVVDEADRTLWTVSLLNNLAAAIDLGNYSVKTYDLGQNVKSPSGVAWDSKRKRLYVANQVTNNTVVLDPSSGQIIKDIALPGGPLNAVYDPLYDVVYVACRTGHKVSVIDANDFSVITELNVTTPNHISLGTNGSVFVTDKSPSSNLYKFTPIKAANSSSAGNTTTSAAGGAAGHSSAAGAHSSAQASGAHSSAQASGAHSSAAAHSSAGGAGGAGGAAASGSAGAHSSVAVASGSQASGSGIAVHNAAATAAPAVAGLLAAAAYFL